MELWIKDLQLMLLDMLVDIDRVCQNHQINYQLFAGSALGAVRHKGFIPWDDDLDIAFSRNDYEKFLRVAPLELKKSKYLLQPEFSEHFPMFYSKLRRNGTTYMERYHPRDDKMNQGVFVDLFPIDNLSDNSVIAKLQFLSSKIVIAKCLRKRGYETDSVKKKLFMALCSILPLRLFWRFTVRKKDVNSKKVHSFFGGSSKFEKSIYPRSILETKRCIFESGEFPVSSQSDNLLTILYGDYMSLPDESQRNCKKHYLKVDLYNSYENYIDWQKNQKITEYTRSIR